MRETTVRVLPGHTIPLVDALLRQMIQERWRTFTQQLARVRRSGSAEAVHDVRVATRRILATLTLVNIVLATKAGRKVRRPARTLLKTLNALRDVQVQLGVVRRSARTYPILRSYGLHLRRRETILLREAATAFRAFPLARIEQDLGALEAELDRTFDRPSIRQAGLHQIRGTAAAAYARVMSHRRAIRFDRPDSLHRYRVAFKKFRYSIELLEPVFPWVTRDLRKAMNRYQTALGKLQDLEVLSSGLRAFARTRRPLRVGPSTSFLPVYRSLERRRELLLARFRESLDDVDRFWDIGGSAE